MLMLWMFGAQEEQDWGPKRFIEFYLFCVAGAGLVTIAVAYSPLPGVTPATTTLGASGGVYGILMAFGMLYGDREIIMFPLPFMMKAKYMVAIMIFLVIIATFHRVPVYQIFPKTRPDAWNERALLQSAKCLLPLEAPASRQEVRSLYAGTQPHRGIRRAWQLHSAR